MLANGWSCSKRSANFSLAFRTHEKRLPRRPAVILPALPPELRIEPDIGRRGCATAPPATPGSREVLLMCLLILQKWVDTPHCVPSQPRCALDGFVSFQARVGIPASGVGAARAFPENVDRVLDIRIAIGNERGLRASVLRNALAASGRPRILGRCGTLEQSVGHWSLASTALQGPFASSERTEEKMNFSIHATAQRDRWSSGGAGDGKRSGPLSHRNGRP